VVFHDIAKPYDLRLQNVAKNDAIDMHTASTGAGMTMPALDLRGVSRPYNTNYDCGPYEWLLPALIAQSLLASAPEISTPWLGQIHQLTASGILTGNPGIGTAASIHNLSARGILTGNPVISTPVLNANILTAPGILTGAPEISVPVLGQVHVLTAQDIITGEPRIKAPKWVVSTVPEDRTFTIAFENRTSIVT
jgi:hypothetical protein